MIKNESIVYKDETFFVLNTGKYYHSGCHGKNANPERLLHRRIWTEHNGEIPSDHHIHHINKNWRDNRIENLELWVVKQPLGQRAEDLIAYAKEILRLYEPESITIHTI